MVSCRKSGATLALGNLTRNDDNVAPIVWTRDMKEFRSARIAQVMLSTLPADDVQSMLPQLLPPLLSWCSNKHAHLKYQARGATQLSLSAQLIHRRCAAGALLDGAAGQEIRHRGDDGRHA